MSLRNHELLKMLSVCEEDKTLFHILFAVQHCNFLIFVDEFLLLMNSMKLVIPLHFISRQKTPNDAVTPQHQSQFTPKMKANAVPRLLSSLV